MIEFPTVDEARKLTKKSIEKDKIKLNEDINKIPDELEEIIYEFIIDATNNGKDSVNIYIKNVFEIIYQDITDKCATYRVIPEEFKNKFNSTYKEIIDKLLSKGYKIDLSTEEKYEFIIISWEEEKE